MKYKLISKRTFSEFEEGVNQLLIKNWKLYGNPHSVCNPLTGSIHTRQALVLPENKKEELTIENRSLIYG